MRILIQGEKAQEVGYRLFLLEKALASCIERMYARNVEEDKIELFVKDDEKKVSIPLD